MKTRLIILLILLQLPSFAQSKKDYEQKLTQLAQKREKCIEDQRANYDENLFDSLEKVNTEFDDYLLKITSTIPESLQCKFKTLQEQSIGVYTSEDGNFRIYSWDTYEGGTMHFFRNILQYKVDGKVYSKIFNSDKDDSGVDFYELNQVTSNGKNYYITSSIMIGSSAVYYYEAKVFCIENGTLNEKAQLIKTKSGMQNTVGYDIDFSSDAYGKDKSDIDAFEYMRIEYDKKSNTILLALLNENGIVTTKKIKYKFNGTYFEKVKN